MNIVLTGRKIEITPALKKYAEDKIGKIEKYLKNITEAHITLSIQKYMHKVEVVIKAGGATIQAESITQELYSAIDEVAEKIMKQVKKVKEKAKDEKTRTRRKVEVKSRASAIAEMEPKVPETGTIVERKRQALKPMPAEEAAMRLESIKLGFFVFTDADTGKISVIYKRADGNFGLIEPVQK